MRRSYVFFAIRQETPCLHPPVPSLLETPDKGGTRASQGLCRIIDSAPTQA
jgi:hypothetical protein